MSELLKNKIAWITGASRGIGRAIALAFAKQGATTILCARSEEGLQETAAQIKSVSSTSPMVLPYDVLDLEATKKAFGKIHKEFGRLDIAVNNAGIIDDALIGMIGNGQIECTLGTNTEAVIYHTQLAVRLMRKSRSGSIINISSIVGRFGNRGQVVYAASKAAVIGITLSTAKELAEHNIRANAIAPGFIDTDLTRSLPQKIYEERMKSILMGRVGSAQEVASVAVFLASDMASFVTGQVIGVDGGMQI